MTSVETSFQHESFESVVLHVAEGPGKGQTFPLAPGENVIGRAPDVQVRLDQSDVSRQHATITVGREIELEDMGSAVGTVLNGRMLMAKDFLFDNDEIRLGPVTLRLAVRRRENRKHIVIALLCLTVSLVVFLLSVFVPDQLASAGRSNQKQTARSALTTNWRNWETLILPSEADLQEERIQISLQAATEEYDLGTRLYLDRLSNLGNAYQALLHYKRALAILRYLKPVEDRPAIAHRSLQRLRTLKAMLLEENEKRVFSFQRALKLRWWKECRRILDEMERITPWAGCRYYTWARAQRRSLMAHLGKG